MPFDSLVRTRQLNKPELSGYVVEILLQYLTGTDINTGDLTGAFYPLYENPSGYLSENILTGYFSKIDASGNNTYLLSYVDSRYYPRYNPSGFITSGDISSGVLFKNTPNVFKIYESGVVLYDDHNSLKILEYAPDDSFILRGFSGSTTGTPIINLGPGHLGRPYISGLDVYTERLNGQPALNSGQIYSKFVPWDYFDTGQNLYFNYLSLNDTTYLGKLVYNRNKYIIQGYNSLSPSVYCALDLYGKNAIDYGLTYTRPTIFGFDILSNDIKLSGNRVLTTLDSGGFISYNNLITASGDLHLADEAIYTYIDSLTGIDYQFTGEGGITVTRDGDLITISGEPNNTLIDDSYYVKTTGDQAISGDKIFYDIGGYKIFDSSARKLYGIHGKSAISLVSLYLMDTGEATSLDWQNRWLNSSSGGTATLDWSKGLLRKNSATSLDWYNKILSGDWNVGGILISGRRPLTGLYIATSGNQSYTGNLNFSSGDITISGKPVTTGGPYYPRYENPSDYVNYFEWEASTDDFDPKYFQKISGVSIQDISGISIIYNGSTVPSIDSARYILQVQAINTDSSGRTVYSRIKNSGYYDNYGSYNMNLIWTRIPGYTGNYILKMYTQPFGGGAPWGPYSAGAWALSTGGTNGVDYNTITWTAGTTGTSPLGAIPNWITFTGQLTGEVSSVLGLPTDGVYGGPNGPIAGIQEGDTHEDALDKIDYILGKLAPPKPPIISTKSIFLNQATYSGYAQGTNNIRYNIINNNGYTGFVTGFYGGDNKVLNLEVNGSPAGFFTIFSPESYPNLQTGNQHGDLTVYNKYDYWSGQVGHSGFWYCIDAKFTPASILNVGAGDAYTARMYIDSDYTPTFTGYKEGADQNPYCSSGGFYTGNCSIRYIDGVKSLETGDQIQINFTAEKTTNAFYPVNIASISGECFSSINISATGLPISGQSLTLSGIVSPSSGIFSTGVLANIVINNSVGWTGLTGLNTNLYIDTISNQQVQRKTAGIGQFPIVGYNAAYDNTINLSLNEELQMISGKIQNPQKINYGLFIPSGFDYSNIQTGSFSGYRWSLFDMGNITNASNIQVTFNGAINFGNDVVNSGFMLYSQISGRTNWVDGNSAYPGVGNPTNNGDAALVINLSSPTMKTITFGSAALSGPVYIRVGLPSGSNKSFGSVGMSVV